MEKYIYISVLDETLDETHSHIISGQKHIHILDLDKTHSHIIYGQNTFTYQIWTKHIHISDLDKTH